MPSPKFDIISFICRLLNILYIIVVKNLSKRKKSQQEHLKHLIDISTSRRAVRNIKIH